MSDEHNQRFAPLLFAAGIGALALLLYTVREIANPFVACGLALFVLYRLRRETYARPLLWAALMITAIWVVYDVSAILVPFAIAFLFAFLFDPLVTRLAPRVPRWVSALCILVVIISIAVTAGMFLVPPVILQLQDLTRSASTLVSSLSFWFSEGGLSNLLRSVNLPEAQVKSFVGDQIAPRAQAILATAFNAVLQFVSSGTYLLGQIVNIVLMPFLGFYLLKDFPALRAAAHKFLIAIKAPSQSLQALADIDALVSAYLRGQLFVASITGALAAIIFSFGGVPYAILLGLMIAVLDVVPYVGLIANITFSCIVVLLGPEPSAPKVMFVAGVILALNLLETNVIAPRIIGQRVGLHPVVIILSIFVFAHVLGLVGLLIAVPTTAVAGYLVRAWLNARVSTAQEPQ